MWAEHWRPFIEYLHEVCVMHGAGSLDETTLFTHFMVFSDHLLHLELSFQNNETLDLLTYSQMATF